MASPDDEARNAQYNRRTNVGVILGLIWFVGISWLLISMMPKDI